ncbi:hypothetical protein ILUMI_11571 [Ignelater luminosus]|uniref:Pacifastin domain-containing protein n=1 Tax=Ignelater luminosus TaxID=2038154 RepID=A0A8K0CVU2_IGNLU|nr:hypothetical protein ILUMI_11571 [Ignelater luminosus]
MNINKFTVIALTCGLLEIDCHRIYCVPGQDYHVQCNRCWCVEGRAFVCSNMKCNRIPNKFWKAAKLNISHAAIVHSALRSSLLMQAVKQSAKTIGPYVIEQVTESLADAFLNTISWMGDKVKDFGRWLYGFLG